ncbi:MAG: lipoate--protein ligase [Bacteroidia bacterium]|nr:lipoate--protein ligase [Bacteroidia bacterium]
MFCLNLKSTDPFFNLAVDEYLLKHRKEDFFVLSVNNPSVIIGKHQVAHREADTVFVTDNNIPVIRRISGGGAVFHDEGNLNFSFIFQSVQGRQVDFRKYTLPVIGFLSTLGVDAKFEGKNDLKVDGLKISGNAEHVFRQRVLHHGTLLFDSKMEILSKSLRKDTSAYLTRAVSSNPSSVVNLKERIPGMNMSEFTSSMFQFFSEREKENELIQLTPEEKSVIDSLAESKYRRWDWNYAYGPEYQINKEFEIDGIKHHCSLKVTDGIIRECNLEGSAAMSSTSKKLIGCRHMPEDIEEMLNIRKAIFVPWMF